MTDRVGQHLGSYRLMRLLGRGGFADVYLGEHRYLQSLAALKVLRTQLNEEDAASFMREGQLLARLSHPHILRVLDFALDDGTPFLVMEYAPGGSLRTRHPAGSHLPLETIVAYVTQVASALQCAHDQRLMHRDVKPENILLSSNDQVLLADFGLAKLTPHSQSGSTQAMELALTGTAPYLSPEQLQGQPRPASDQYALGMVVYEWLAGRRPFEGSPLEIAMQHLSAPVPPLRPLVPDLSRAAEEVVLRALAKESRLRFPSVLDFAAALQQACQERTPPLQTSPYLASPFTSEPSNPASSAPAMAAMPEPVSSQSGSSPPGTVPPPGSGTQESEPLDLAPAPPLSLWQVPATFTPLIGREQEVAAICAEVMRPEVRLVTLLGPGGIGKTRLSIQVAHQLRPAFADGVVFVELAPVREPGRVLPAIAQEGGVRESAHASLLQQLQAFLVEKRLLLLLDNFEQVLTAAVVLQELLAACPRLKLLATSRAVLHLPAEHAFPVAPLSLPALSQGAGLDQVAQSAAVALFVERAQAQLPAFALTAANAHAIAEICIRLDGLPLAIELAAARVKLLPPVALLKRLSQRLPLLVGGSRTGPERQQSLRQTLKWSYDLLGEQEQAVFRLLAVFAGGCTLEAVEEICKRSGKARFDILAALEALLDNSLLQQAEQEEEEPRLVLLETVREYGLELLAELGEVEGARHAHAEYYVELAEAAGLHLLGGGEQARWLDVLGREQENLRAAFAWLLAHQETELAYRLSWPVFRYWYMRGNGYEGLRWLEAALELPAAHIRTAARARVLTLAGGYMHIRGAEPAEGRALLEESLVICQELGDRAWYANTLEYLGFLSFQEMEFASARSLCQQSIAICRELGEAGHLAHGLNLLARIMFDQGEESAARALLEESIALYREAGDRWGLTRPLLPMAVMALRRGDDAEAVILVEENLAIAREMADMETTIVSLLSLASIARFRDAVQATGLAEEALSLALHMHDEPYISQALALLGDMERGQGDGRRAAGYYRESLAHAQKSKHPMAEETRGWCLLGLARLARKEGRLQQAARLIGAGERRVNLDKLDDPLTLPLERAGYEREVSEVRTRLGEKTFARLREEGASLTLEQALSFWERASIHDEEAVSEKAAQARSRPNYPAGLTGREVEILRLVAQGLTDAEIAGRLVISYRTVTTHLSSIYNKLAVSSRTAATRFAIEHQLVH